MKSQSEINELMKLKLSGKKTGKGHAVRIDPKQDHAMLWFLYWNDDPKKSDDENHEHHGIARVSKAGESIQVETFDGTSQTPKESTSFQDSAGMLDFIESLISEL